MALRPKISTPKAQGGGTGHRTVYRMWLLPKCPTKQIRLHTDTMLCQALQDSWIEKKARMAIIGTPELSKRCQLACQGW